MGETDCVFRRQNPTLLMESAMTCSSAARSASRLRVPPSAKRSLATAASVTSSFVCEESMSEMSVAKRLFCHHDTKEIRTKGVRKIKGRPSHVSRTRGSISFHLAVSQPIVSTGAGNRERISLMDSYVSRQCSGAGCGFSRACLIAFGFCGDRDGVRPDLAFLPLSTAGADLAAEGENSPPSLSSSTTSSTLTRFERRGDADGPGSESPSELRLSSLNKVTVGSAELCRDTRRIFGVDTPLRLFMSVRDRRRAWSENVAATFAEAGRSKNAVITLPRDLPCNRNVRLTVSDTHAMMFKASIQYSTVIS